MSHFQNLYKKIVSFSVVVIKSYVTKGWGMNRVSFQSLLILSPTLSLSIHCQSVLGVGHCLTGPQMLLIWLFVQLQRSETRGSFI